MNEIIDLARKIRSLNYRLRWTKRRVEGNIETAKKIMDKFNVQEIW